MKHYIMGLLLALLAVVPGRAEEGLPDRPDSLWSYFKNLASYNIRFTREQVFVHMDNDAYFEGDRIWYSVHVVVASNFRPTPMSRVVYAELLNAAGELVQRQRLRVEDGMADGCFTLDSTCRSGYYEVRAYTRAMLNWDAAGIFSRVVSVFAHPPKAGDFRQLRVDQPDYYGRKRPADSVALPAHAAHQRRVVLGFYPEGGNIVKGLPLYTAFKMTDEAGVSQTGRLRLLSAAGEPLGEVRTTHDGMGRFSLPAAQVPGLRVEATDAEGHTAQFTLPEAQPEGAVLHVTGGLLPGSDTLRFEVAASEAFKRRLLGVSITCRGETHYLDTLRVTNAPAKGQVALSALGQGINQITLFDSYGRVLAERFVWHTPSAPVAVTVCQNAARYNPCQPVVLRLDVTDTAAVRSGLWCSLAVRERRGDVVGHAPGISEQLLLSSGIRGYIARPQYYFEATDSAHLSALDLLLLVQGWRRYDWREMAGVIPTHITQPIEEGMLLDGRVVDGSSKKRPRAGYDLDVSIILPGTNTLKGHTVTDQQGNFSFLSPSFYGEGMGVFTFRKDGKRKYGIVMLNRRFSPKPRRFLKQELTLLPPELGQSWQKDTLPSLFEWKDTIKTDIQLREVEKKAHAFDDYWNGRYSWEGGEGYGQRHAQTFYNANEAVEEYMDAGYDVPSINDWLTEHDKRFSLDFVKLQFKGRDVYTVVDNGAPVTGVPVFLDEVRSIMVVTDKGEMARIFARDGVNSSAALSRYGCVLLLYTDPMMNLFDHRRGERITQLHGYFAPVDFYSPDYRKTDMPTDTDFRRTLYWAPFVSFDEHGEANVLFYSNSRPGQQISVSLQGVTSDGRLIDVER